MRFDRLLVMGSGRLASATESIASDRAKPPLRRLLQFRQPPQGTKPDLRSPLVVTPSSTQDQGVWQFRVIVRRHILEPRPIVGRRVLVPIDQFLREKIADLVHQSVTAEAAGIRGFQSATEPTYGVKSFVRTRVTPGGTTARPTIESWDARPADTGTQHTKRHALENRLSHHFPSNVDRNS